jgi:hypothetical protein
MNKSAKRSMLPGQWIEHQAASGARQVPTGQAAQFDWQACWSNFRNLYGCREPAQPPVIDMKRTT